MGLHSSHFKTAILLICFYVTFPLAATCCTPLTGVAESQPTRVVPSSSITNTGFEISGFTSWQERIIKETITAYARALGGQKKLKQIITTFHHGKNQPITYAPNRVGANADIKLSPTVFSREKSTAAGYSCYAAQDDDTYAQIVLGHEIGHVLVQAAQHRTSVDWAEVYAERVDRDWEKFSDPKAPLEEAVTEFSLLILGQGYYFSINEDAREIDPEIVVEIDSWASDFLRALQNME
jgi:hypothetical protein